MFLSFFGNHWADMVIISGVIITPPADRHMADMCKHLKRVTYGGAFVRA